VASLRRNGCNIRVIVSRSGGHVVRTLKAAGIPVKSASFDRNHNGSIDLYTHTKYMLLSGRYRGGSSWNVWTGSANWAARSFNNDEATVRIPRRSTYLRYSGHFARLWATGYWL
jgi:phosphatidylserine/phosphatidylglycerophosphate/cardiolipin synthase-like enzyme